MGRRICDLVMEGGVTSGIVYPKAIFKLSDQFLFHSIGGTSAGAIAAAATAAAEYRRRVSPNGDDQAGFALLDKLPDELAPPLGKSDTESKLFSLFTPQRETAALFSVLSTALNRSTKSTRALAIAAGFLRAYWFSALVAFLITLALAALGKPGNAWGWLLSVLLASIISLFAALARAFLDLCGPFIRNGFGLCRGYSPGDEKRFAFGDNGEPLTLWLSRLINRCAGLPEDGPPVTFGMLWGAPGIPPQWLKEATSGQQRRSIDLQMVSTSLTHGRPFQFPDADSDVPFFISLDEFKEYFPPNVLEALRNAAEPPQRHYDLSAKGMEGKIVLPLEGLPVIVAARMSLSFPVLLSAVPLYSVDFMPNQWTVKRCWFSDGGLSSNFPIHFFDSLLPLWPTFGISLEIQDSVHQAGDIWMPASNTQGRADPWDDFDAKASGSLAFAEPLFGFVLAILRSIRNWQDRLNARAPGVRDRVVRVRLKEDEGGLNLAMSRAQIEAVAAKGVAAGDELLARYCGVGTTDKPLKHPMDLDNHRWVRLRSLIGAIEKQARGLNAAMRVQEPGCKSWAELVALGSGAWGADADQCPVTRQGARLIQTDLQVLADLATAAIAPPGTHDDAPLRQPVLRVRPEV